MGELGDGGVGGGEESCVGVRVREELRGGREGAQEGGEDREGAMAGERIGQEEVCAWSGGWHWREQPERILERGKVGE